MREGSRRHAALYSDSGNHVCQVAKIFVCVESLSMRGIRKSPLWWTRCIGMDAGDPTFMRALFVI
jgi:hypothetical protein